METGIWRVAGDELFLKGDENPECIAVLRRQQSLLEGESQSLQPPFTVGPCTFRLLDPLPTPTGAEADIVGTSWEWETKNYLIEFFAGGNLRLSVEAKKHSSPFTEYGSWDLEATTLSLKLGLTSASFPIDLAIAQAATLVGTSVSPGESGVKVELVRRGG